jgi:segregation and condensation protein B
MQENLTLEPQHQPAIQEEREDIQEMAAATEALLFASAEPLTLADLRRILAVRQTTLERVLDFLGGSLSHGRRGIRLQRHEDLVRLVTAPETALYISKMRGQQAGQRLSDAALETLALIAYTQPATRPQIEAVRGVDCSGVINTLMARGLVTEVGRLDTVGHPILYGTTLAFLQHFGLESPGQLPPVGELKGRTEAQLRKSEEVGGAAPTHQGKTEQQERSPAPPGSSANAQG